MDGRWWAVGLVLGLAGCGGGRAGAGPEAPIGEGYEAVTVHDGGGDGREACGGQDLVVRASQGDRLLGAVTLEARCVGACTDEAQAAGRAEVERLRALVEAGEASESELDYDFTECVALQPSLGPDLSHLGRPLRVVFTQVDAPHGGVATRAHLVGVGCGRLVVSPPFVGAPTERGDSAHAEYFLADLTAHPTAAGPDAWRHFQLQGRGEWLAEVTWDAATCEWRVRERRDP